MSDEGRTRWRAVWIAIAAGITVGTAVGKIGPAIPLISAEFGLSLMATGWLVSTFNTIAVAGALFFGFAINRAGSLRACAFGLAALVAGGALALLAHDTGLLVAGRIVEGLGALTVIISAPALISAATAPHERGLALGFWSSYMPIGAGLAFLLAPLFVGSALGWRGLWALNAVAALACLLLLLAEARHFPRSGGTRRSLASVWSSLAQPIPWLLAIAFGMYTLQWHGIMVWLPSYLQETQRMGETASALATFAFVVVNIVGNQAGGFLVHRAVPRGRIVATAFAVTSLLFLAIFAESLAPALRYALVLVYSMSTGVVAAAALSGSARYARSPAEVGSIQGLLVQLSQTGVFVSPLAIAFAVTWGGGWHASLAVFLGAGAIGLACGLAILALERREARPAA